MDARVLGPGAAAIAAGHVAHTGAVVPDHVSDAVRRDFVPRAIVKRVFEMADHFHAAPASRLVPIAIWRPSNFSRSKSIDAK
jgi:hypothetical protein